MLKRNSGAGLVCCVLGLGLLGLGVFTSVQVHRNDEYLHVSNRCVGRSQGNCSEEECVYDFEDGLTCYDVCQWCEEAGACTGIECDCSDVWGCKDGTPLRALLIVVAMAAFGCGLCGIYVTAVFCRCINTGDYEEFG